MKTKTLLEILADELPKIQPLIDGQLEVTPENVLQPEKNALKSIVYDIIEKVMSENSEFRGKENLESFLNEINKGKKGIILAEHYSNFDYPMLIRMMEKASGAGKSLADKCYGIAGLKLGEDNKYISAFAEAFARIYIYPSRTIAGITDPQIREKEIKRSRAINIASMRAMEKVRNEGNVIVVFPAGTRYRPGKPETKRGVREIDSYIKISDVMLLVSINGNCLRVSDSSDMTMDTVFNDRMILCASCVYNCCEFREEVKALNPEAKDKKQIIVDRIMAILEDMHNENEIGRI